MQKNKLVVFDWDISYSRNLVDYLLKYKKINMEVVLFTSFEQLLTYIEESEVDVLLITEQALSLLVENRVRQIVILSEEIIESEEELPRIYKYQSAEKIFNSLEEIFKRNLQTEITASSIKRVVNSNLYGVYSPGGGAQCSIVSLALAKAIGDEKRVLLIDCECFSGLPIEKNYEQYYTMSDLIYFAKQKKEEMWSLVKERLYHMENLDILIPVQYYEDLLELSREDVDFFLKQITKDSNYDIILLSIDFYAEFTKALLEQCSMIFMPTIDNVYFKNKEATFFQMLKLEGNEECLEKFQSVYITQQSFFNTDISIYSQSSEIQTLVSTILKE